MPKLSALDEPAAAAETDPCLIVENPDTAPITIPHGGAGVDVPDLHLGPLERKELTEPEIWARSRHFQRARRDGRILVFEGTYRDLEPPPPLAPEIRAALASDPRGIDKAWHLVTHPNVAEVMDLINVQPSRGDAAAVSGGVVGLTEETRDWLKGKHRYTLEAALHFAAQPRIQALARRQGRDLGSIVKACRKRIAEIQRL
jgi:hypothetical protein